MGDVLLLRIKSAGWNVNTAMKGASSSDRDRSANMAKTQASLKAIVDKVRLHDCAWPFLEPVDRAQVRIAQWFS